MLTAYCRTAENRTIAIIIFNDVSFHGPYFSCDHVTHQHCIWHRHSSEPVVSKKPFLRNHKQTESLMPTQWENKPLSYILSLDLSCRQERDRQAWQTMQHKGRQKKMQSCTKTPRNATKCTSWDLRNFLAGAIYTHSYVYDHIMLYLLALPYQWLLVIYLISWQHHYFTPCHVSCPSVCLISQ